MKKAVIYTRFSSNKQTEDSTEAQLRACMEYAQRNGLLVVGQYKDEAISGKGSKTLDRCGYQSMLKDVQNKTFDTILIHKYDRIARSIAEHVKLENILKDNNIVLVAVAQNFGSSNEAVLMRSLMWGLSEYYNLNLADETRKGLKERALKGMHTGGYAPFGYDVVNGYYFINEMEAHFVKKIFNCAVERIGFNDVIEEMQSSGVKGKRGKPIKYTQIYEMLRNEKYTGTYKYSTHEEKKRQDRRAKPNAIIIENAFPVIIEKKIFDEVQEIMNQRKQTGSKSDFLCSGMVYCECGAKMHGRTSTRKQYKYKYYSCSAKCGLPSVKAEVLENAALEYLHILLSKKNEKAIYTALSEYSKNNKIVQADFKQITKNKINEKQKEYNNLYSNFKTGLLTGPILDQIVAEMNSLQAEIEALKQLKPLEDYSSNIVINWLESIKEAPDKRALQLLIERVDITQKNTIEFKFISTLNSIVHKNGCGGRI